MPWLRTAVVFMPLKWADDYVRVREHTYTHMRIKVILSESCHSEKESIFSQIYWKQNLTKQY